MFEQRKKKSTKQKKRKEYGIYFSDHDNDTYIYVNEIYLCEQSTNKCSYLLRQYTYEQKRCRYST